MRHNVLLPKRAAVVSTAALALSMVMIVGVYAGRPVEAASPVLVGAGDIASGSNQNDEATARVVEQLNPTAVITLGDNAYESGTSSEFANYYHPTWGRFKAKTYPVAGNHEYKTSGASGHYGYFGTRFGDAGNPAKGYYAFNVGEWRIYALNSSNCANGNPSCTYTSEQITWLRNNLRANPKKCTLAYWHHPLYSSGYHGNSTIFKPAFRTMFEEGGDLVLVGHDHDYERFAPMDYNGNLNTSKGVREIVVGTGGKELRPFATIKANSQVRNASTYGVLKLTLHPTSYEWKFVPVAGKTFTDSGSANCH